MKTTKTESTTESNGHKNEAHGGCTAQIAGRKGGGFALAPDAKQRAYEQLRGECDALGAAECAQFNLDMTLVPSMVSAALVRCAVFAPQLAQFPKATRGLLGRIEVENNALIYAQSMVATVAVPRDSLPEQLVTLNRNRVKFEGALRLLMFFGALRSDALDGLPVPSGYSETVAVVWALLQIVRACWSDLAGQSPVTAQLVGDTEVLCDEMTAAVGAREKCVTEQALWQDRRRRVATLLLRDYAELRAGMEYLRRLEGDAVQFAPTLYDNTKSYTRAASKKSEEKKSEEKKSEEKPAEEAKKPAEEAKKPAEEAKRVP